MFVLHRLNLHQIVSRAVEALGYECVDLEASGRASLLRVFIDRRAPGDGSAVGAGGGVTIDDCVAVSNQLTRVLDVEGVEYGRLEVSSPGLDRPLRSAGDFVRFLGSRASISLRVPINGRKRFTGTLVGFDDKTVVLALEGAALSVPLVDIEKARLVPDI